MFEVYRGRELVARFRLLDDARRFVRERGPGLLLAASEPARRSDLRFPRIETVPYTVPH